MKNFKRILALVIAIVMVVGTFASLSAAGSKWYSEAVTFIEENGIAVIGANADKKITRNEFVLWVAKIESHQLSDTAWSEQIANTVFTDVTDAHYKAAIAYSARRNFIIGNGDGTFSPDKATTFAEACAVIVRVMGYENKVYDTSADAWAFNYMQVANTYCHAIDDVFMKETDTYNPDYELTQGEAAYLLATIMNFNKQPTDSDYSETSDGINLGEWFDVNGGSTGVVGKSYYVQSINRVCKGESMSTLLALGGQKGLLYTNELDTAKDVVLLPTDGTAPLVIDGASFLKMLRISLGLNPERDIANEEPEINVFSYLDVGSIVNIVIDKSATSTNAYLDNDSDGTYTEVDQKIMVSSLSASSNSVIVDTYLQATSAKEGEDYGDGSNNASAATNLIISAADLSKYVGWTIREIGTTENTCPVLPASYSAELATSWTNVVKDADGVVTSAVLNFKGQTYTVNGSSDEIAIYSGDDLTTVLTPDEAVNAIINIAQGEALVVFNDIDGDGRYDSAIVKESDPFLYVGTPNVAGSATATYDYYSSISNGTVIGNARMKGNALGTVIYNKSVEFAAGGTTGVADYRTDGYLLKDRATGKMQLILRASNKHFFIDGATDSYGNASPHFYKVVDLATFGVGVIEEVDAFALDNYYVAKIVQTDGTTKTVYIPVTPSEKTTLPVTVDGVTADYTFGSSNWCTFLTQMKDEVIASGIVSGVEDPSYKSATAAWMAGKYVQFAVDADSKVIVMLGTDSSANVSGFVTGVTKTDTGDNTFNVSIATYSSSKVAGVSTYEVRANASSMFDWQNYEVYNAIFSSKLADPYGMEDGRVNADEDLIYVTVYQDAATKYLKYNSTLSASSWVNVEGRYNISLTEVDGSRVYADDKSSYTADYKGTVGFGPYYERTYNTTKKAYEYVLKFTRVVEYTGITGSATAVIDKTKTLMTPVYVGESGTVSTQLKATTDADFEKYTIANGFYIDDVTNLVYQLIDKAEIVYKTDDKGNIVYSDVKYDEESAEIAVEYTSGTEVLFSTYKVGKYATFTYAAADRDTTEGWYPGLSTVTLDGTTYTATSSTPVVIVTPSSDGFTTTTTTLANVSTDGLFVTDWNAVVTDGKLSAIAIIGEKTAAYTDGSGTVTPTPTDEGTLVYLDSNAKAIVRAAAYGKSWLVVSDRSAYALPTGEEIGVIYREYSTYEEATKAASIDLMIVGGHWYRIDENGKILSDASDITYETLPVVSLDGYQKITMIGNNSGSNWTGNVFEFYVSADTEVTERTFDSKNPYGNAPAGTYNEVPEGTELIYVNDDGSLTYYTNTKASGWTRYGVYRFTKTTKGTVSCLVPELSTLVSTTTEGNNIYLSNGKNYLVEGTVAYAIDDQVHKIEVEVKPIGTKQGTITKTDAAGNTYATIDGVKNVNVTNYDFAFFYRNADASVLYKAGDSTSVTVATREIYNAQIKTQQDAYDKAVAAYEEALAKGYLSEERIAYYKAEVDKTKAELVEAKNSLLDKYFNGRFWGVPNSPYYLYVQLGSGSFQQPTSTLTFNYVKVGDTYCVFSDEFILG